MAPTMEDIPTPQPIPTPPKLSYFHFAAAAMIVALAYMPINIVYAMWLTSVGAGTQIIPDSPFLAFFAEHVPSIRRTIEDFSGEFEPERLAVIVRLYTFAWASGIFDILLQTAFFFCAVLMTREEYRRTLQEPANLKLPPLAHNRVILSIAFMLLVLSLLLDATFSSYGRGLFHRFRSVDTSDMQQVLAWTAATFTYVFAASTVTSIVMLGQGRMLGNATTNTAR